MKGQVAGVWFVLIFLIVIMLFAGMWMYTQLVVRPPVVPIEYEGEFDKIYAPEEVTGTDLSVVETDITDGATLRTCCNMSFDINDTDGQTLYMAFGIEISGTNGFESLDIDGSYGADITTTAPEIEFRRVYILEDEEGIDLEQADARWVGDVAADQDEFEFRLGVVPEGDYVLCIEVKSVSTSTIGSGEELVKIEFDGESENEIDDFTVYIHNA